MNCGRLALQSTRRTIGRRRVGWSRLFSAGKLADECDQYIVKSPFNSIHAGPHPPLYEFVSQNWERHGGTLGEKIAIVDGNTGLERSFDDYYQTSRGFAGALQDFGLSVDSTVAIFCPNHVDYAPIVLGTSIIGGKVTPVNPMYTANELDTVLERSQSQVLVVHSSKLDMALECAKKCQSLKQVVVVTDAGEPILVGTIRLDDLRNHEGALDKTVDSVGTKTPVCLPYSSGTTGLPKGVCLTHDNLVANLLQWEVIEHDVFPGDHQLISPLPFFHIYAFTVSMMYSAWKGQTVITSSGRFDLEQFCKLVELHKPDRSHLVPPILLGLAKHPVVDKYDMSSLKTIVSAAATLSKETENEVMERLGCKVKQAWGMSELSPIGTACHDDNAKSGSVGPLVSSTYGKVIDPETGKSLPPNTPGELCLRGPQVMLGYMNQPDKTAECLSDSGWLRTGDIAHYDEDGHFYITDRIKELIKCRGYQVAPAELENLLLTNDAVNDCAVIQIPDEASGELPRAYIVLKENYNPTQEDLYEWVKERVAPYKRLDGGIVFCDSIPKSASGKILRRILRDQVKDELSSA